MKYYRMYWLIYIVSIFIIVLFEDYVVMNNLLSDRLYLCLFEMAWTYFGASSCWIGTITHKHNMQKKQTKTKR